VLANDAAWVAPARGGLSSRSLTVDENGVTMRLRCNHHLRLEKGVPMRRTAYLSLCLFLGLLTPGLLTCGGSSLTMQETCNQAMAAMCDRASACGINSYSSVAECTTAMQTANCSDPTALTCPAGTVFSSTQAQKCIDEQKAQSCTDLANDVMPTACGLVCAVSNTGGSGGAGGTLAIQDACKQVMAIMCERTSTCVGASGLSALGYTSVASCTSGMQADACGTPQQAACDPGMTYYPDQAQQCINSLSTLACTDFTNDVYPPACDLVCQ
jgi:hypothetical protein